jgi:flagellar basal body rod protein FlgG
MTPGEVGYTGNDLDVALNGRVFSPFKPSTEFVTPATASFSMNESGDLVTKTV